MEIGKAVYKLLKDSAGVGAICADRIYPEMAQQDVDVPFIVYTVTDTTPSGTKNATSKLDTGRVELYCISDDYEQAMNLGIAVRSALDRQSGTISAVEVQSIDFDTSDITFDPDQRVYVLEQTYDVRIQRTGTAQVVTQFPGNVFTVEEVDGDPSGAVNKLVFSNGSVSITDRTATITTGGVGVQYHGRYDTEAETERSGATATLEVYYTARPDGDGFAESEVSDVGETDTINRTLYYSTKFQADPDTAGDWTEYTTQPADNATFATAKAALLAGLNETDAIAETRGTLPLSLKMVRTTTAAAVDLLLDTYTGAAAAYSVRKLDKDYTGYCMKVRRASDAAEADIGFDGNGDLDTAAIASHCGASAGFVSVWYDQSGNSNNASQSTPTKQPQIYNGSAVYQSNSKPAIYVDPPFSNVACMLELGTAVTMDSIFMVVQKQAIDTPIPGVYYITGNSTANADHGVGIGGSAIGDDAVYWDAVTSFPSLQSTTSVGTSQRLISVHADATTDSLALDGTEEDTGTVSPTTIANIFNRRITNDDNRFEGYCQEMIIWDTDQSSNRTGIETNIDTYFQIPGM